MDKSWMQKDRLSEEYEKGIKLFLKFAVDHASDPNSMKCPCMDCVNVCRGNVALLKDHLTTRGMDETYHIWLWHGEDLPETNNPSLVNKTVEGFVSDLFETPLPDDAPATIEMVEAAQEEYTSDPGKFQKLLEDAEKPLYPSCTKFTKLSALVKLYNIKARSGWSDKSFSTLLSLLNEMLPEDNEIPVSMYEAKKTLNALGMEYEKIHACPNDCILYRKEHAKKTLCPTCNTSRWKINERTSKEREGVPAKVFWYFPPIPRFRRMFQSVETSKMLTWHKHRKETVAISSHPSDSPAWKLVDYKWPDFAADARNLRLALSADGINPHNSLSSRYSCWPILMITYNLPPWMCMKRKFMMLSGLISGPQQPGNDIDVYLAPLVDDLNKLWDEGVQAYDAYQKQSFTLRAVLLWTISDFPAYGSLSGCPVKGYHACPICGEETSSTRLKHSRKNCYLDHRKFLPHDHPFRNQKEAFNGEKEYGDAPEPLTGEELFEIVKNIENQFGKMTTSSGKKRPRNVEGSTYMKKVSIFFTLPYWKYLLIRHCLDVMHIEKNVSESIIGTLLNIPGKSKDGFNARKDLEELGLRNELTPQVDTNNRTYLPAACFTMVKDEKFRFCNTFFGIKTPEGYSSNIRNRVSMQDLKLYGMKSHDHHTLMQQLLPLAIRSVLPNHVRSAITRFCIFFRSLCTKEIDVTQLRGIQKDLVVTLCLLEKYFPPSFFDIMIHLTVHLVREVQLCGPVCFRWMYPFERFMKFLKGYVRNRNHPEGCIAECYIAEEAIEFCSEYLSDMSTIGIPQTRNDGNNGAQGENLVSDGRPHPGGKVTDVGLKLWSQAHRTVLNNTNEVLPYIEKHMSYLKEKDPRKSKNEKWLLDEHIRTFISWIRDEVEIELNNPNNNISKHLKWIAHGPRHQIIKYPGYDINGCRYHTRDRDATRVNQNSGVSIVATATHVASPDDINPLVADTCYYGVIDEIWLLDYNIIKIPIFKCNWVESGKGIKNEEFGLTLVELGRLGHKTDPFILASQARQVFYVEDQADSSWSIVLSMPQRNYFHGDIDDDMIDFNCHGGSNIVLPNDDAFDTNDESQSDYIRVDGEHIWVDLEPEVPVQPMPTATPVQPQDPTQPQPPPPPPPPSDMQVD